MGKYEALLEQFNDATKGLASVLGEEKTEFIRDSAIKRFELAFDLAWKTIKAFMEKGGVSCTSPLGCFKEAYRQGLIDFEKVWIDAIQTRNKTVHTYDQKLAEEVYLELPGLLSIFQKLLSQIKEMREKQKG